MILTGILFKYKSVTGLIFTSKQLFQAPAQVNGYIRVIIGCLKYSPGLAQNTYLG